MTKFVPGTTQQKEIQLLKAFLNLYMCLGMHTHEHLHKQTHTHTHTIHIHTIHTQINVILNILNLFKKFLNKKNIKKNPSLSCLKSANWNHCHTCPIPCGPPALSYPPNRFSLASYLLWLQDSRAMLDVLKSYPACDNSLMRVFKVFMLESNTLGFSIICEALIFSSIRQSILSLNFFSDKKIIFR